MGNKNKKMPTPEEYFNNEELKNKELKNDILKTINNILNFYASNKYLNTAPNIVIPLKFKEYTKYLISELRCKLSVNYLNSELSLYPNYEYPCSINYIIIKYNNIYIVLMITNGLNNNELPEYEYNIYDKKIENDNSFFDSDGNIINVMEFVEFVKKSSNLLTKSKLKNYYELIETIENTFINSNALISDYALKLNNYYKYYEYQYDIIKQEQIILKDKLERLFNKYRENVGCDFYFSRGGENLRIELSSKNDYYKLGVFKNNVSSGYYLDYFLRTRPNFKTE